MDQVTSILPRNNNDRIAYTNAPILHTDQYISPSGPIGKYWGPSNKDNPNPGSHTIYVDNNAFMGSEPPWICTLDNYDIYDKFPEWVEGTVFAYQKVSKTAHEKRINDARVQNILKESVRVHEKSHIRQEILYDTGFIHSMLDTVTSKKGESTAEILSIRYIATKETISILEQIDYLEQTEKLSGQEILAHIFATNIPFLLAFYDTSRIRLQKTLEEIYQAEIPNINGKRWEYCLALLMIITGDTDILEKLEKQQTTPEEVTKTFVSALSKYLETGGQLFRQDLLIRTHKSFAKVTKDISDAAR